MEFLHAIILGIIEGITEFLPVSSTGHLLIAGHLLGTHKSDAFNVLIQVGPIFAAALVFWRDILRLLTEWKDPVVKDERTKLFACFLLTGIAGLAAKKLGLELPDTVLPIAIATLVGALVIFAVEYHFEERKHGSVITWGMVVAVAAAQLLAAVFPGTSRSGAAVFAALLLGLSRPAAVRFAFLVGIPTMFAAGALQIKDAIEAGQTAELVATPALLAFVVATITAWLTVVWLLHFVRHRSFLPFAWYRLVLGILLIALELAWVRGR